MGLQHVNNIATRLALACWLTLAMLPGLALGALDSTGLSALASGSMADKLQQIKRLGEDGSTQATETLRALSEGRLRINDQGRLVLLQGDGRALDLGSHVLDPAPGALRPLTLNNRLRRAIADALAVSQLFSPSSSERLAAAQRLQQSANPSDQPAIERALQNERDKAVRRALETALARIQLASTDHTERLAAIATLGQTGDASFRPLLTQMLNTHSANTVSDTELQAALTDALEAIDHHQRLVAWSGNIFYGLSLGSVLLLAALGLAITFGLMGVINMAHGELLMIGAYATYVVQRVFNALIPSWADWYVLAALPIAFLSAGAVGMLMERTVIRWLYGRPLETLLATWGISLILMQTVRSVFGAQNVEVSNPSWMSGGVTILGDLVLSYNRLTIIAFALVVVFFVWLVLNHTRLGLFVRAITQNRRMADCVGVPTGRIDTLAFGLGAGIAGLGGVALSQLGNVGPDLGRAYIVDSFMVVVLGGVGQLAGTVIAAFGLGSLTKFLEPWSGAVLAKIGILVMIVLFVQKRPQGLFAPKGRSVE